MSPEISIIIPVYNVEQYLWRCLDSVVHQTLEDIQIICVDHSSTDGSLAILEEFAAKDSRIEIIPCENTGGGPGQARNAGLDHVRGKYIYFADSDDWLDVTLCEKAYYRLEQTQCDLVFIFCEQGQQDRTGRPLKDYEESFAPEELSYYFDFQVMTWLRMIRTSFLREMDIRFPEAMIPEDAYFHWILLSHEPKIELIPEKLYHYTYRRTSIMGQRGEYVAKSGYVFTLIKKYYQEHGKYEKYRELLLRAKMNSFVRSHNILRGRYKELAIPYFKDTLDEDELQFLRESPWITPKTRKRILELLGEGKFRRKVKEMVRVCFNIMYRPVKILSRKIRMFFMRKQIAIFQNRIQELNAQIAKRDKVIVELKAFTAEEFQIRKKRGA